MLLSRDETFLLYFLAPEFPAEREPVVYLTLGLIGLAWLQDFCLFILYSFFFSSSGLFVRQ